MKKQCNSISIFYTLLFWLVLWLATSLTTILAQLEVEDEREFDYIEGGMKGPQKWGELKKEWAACKTGEKQSPVDMLNQRVKIVNEPRELKRNHRPSNATVKNRGHDISLQWVLGEAGSIQIDGSEYFLQQGHWHSPSEHTINGMRYDMELHLVHLKGNEIAVIGLLYKIGQPDPFLSQLMRNISSMTKQMERRDLGVIDPRDILLGGRKYYRYIGSLTVPPCTEGVIWIIKQQVRTVSEDQVNLLREAVHDYANRNARPLQPINSREILLYDP